MNNTAKGRVIAVMAHKWLKVVGTMQGDALRKDILGELVEGRGWEQEEAARSLEVYGHSRGGWDEVVKVIKSWIDGVSRPRALTFTWGRMSRGGTMWYQTRTLVPYFQELELSEYWELLLKQESEDEVGEWDVYRRVIEESLRVLETGEGNELIIELSRDLFEQGSISIGMSGQQIDEEAEKFRWWAEQLKINYGRKEEAVKVSNAY